MVLGQNCCVSDTIVQVVYCLLFAEVLVFKVTLLNIINKSVRFFVFWNLNFFIVFIIQLALGWI